MKLSVIAALAAIVWMAVGCSHGHSPLAPGLPRQASIFNTEPYALFQAADQGLVLSAGGFHEAALGTLCRYGPVPGNGGEQINYNGYGTAAVSLLRPDVTDPHAPFKPVFRWLQGNDAGGLGTASDVRWVTYWDYSSGSDQAEYRSPKCEAIYGLGFGHTVVELAVCYVVRGLTQPEVNSKLGSGFWDGGENPDYAEVNTDWDIGLTVLRWCDNDPHFPDGEPFREDFIIPDEGGEAQYSDYDPDVAYDPTTGDLLLVWSSDQTVAEAQVRRIRYAHFTRTYNALYAPYVGLRPSWTYDNGWNYYSGDDYWPLGVQKLDSPPSGNGEHNGHQPSIDIGLIDIPSYPLLPPLPPGHHEQRWTTSTYPWVVIAYTSQFQGGHTGYHVMVGGWPLGSFNARTFFPLRHPWAPMYYLDAGLPCVDIAPNQNGRHNAAVVFDQCVGEDGYGPQMSVYEADLFGLYNLSIPDQYDYQAFYPVPSPDTSEDGLFPSISLFQETGTSGPFHASVAFMAQTPEGDTLTPTAATITITPSSIYDPPSATRSIGLWFTLPQTGDITGNYNLSQIPFLDPGFSSAVVTDTSNRFWAAWCPRIEMEPPPDIVWGAYGYAYQ